MKELTGKVALVTGAGRGIGRAIAKRLAQVGVAICIVDIDKEAAESAARECEFLGISSCTAVVDIGRRDQASDAVSTCLKHLGGVDILVNNAGILGRYALLEDTDEIEFDSIFGVNGRGLLNMVHAVVPAMKSKGWGRIINAASMYGSEPQVGRGIYSASKAAVITFTRVLAAELAPYGVTVNAYAPGTIATDMSSGLQGKSKEDKVKQIPLRRFGLPEEVAELVAFLASEKASYITGTVVGIDGGVLAVQSPWRVYDMINGSKGVTDT